MSSAVVEVDYNSIVTKGKDLVYWRKPHQSGVVFGLLLTVEIVLMSMSFLSIVGYSGLAILFALIGFRTFLKVSGKQDTYKILEKLDHKIELTSSESEKMTRMCVEKVEIALEHLRELFLLNNVANSIKFGFALYLLTYIGARFNFLTLCLIATILLFSCPKVYELKKNEIDQLLAVAKDKLKDVQKIAMDKLSQIPIPGLTAGSKPKAQ